MASIRSGIGEKMEDRYLFKAKRIDNGEWEIGSLIALPTGEYEISNKCNNPPDCAHIWNKVVITHKVDPSTICQCTGLKDKNGKLIWENDIVRVTINSGSTICRCAFADTVANFQLWQKHTIKSTSTVLNLGNYECEVIGNIFDNQELLESEE